MATITVTPSKTFSSGEVVTATKLNLLGAPTVAVSAIAAADLAADSVTTVKIADANVTPAKLSQPLTLLAAQPTTSGTAATFSSIPSWAKRITMMLSGVSTTGTGNLLIQLGAGSTATTGYSSYGMSFGSSGGNGAGFDSGFGIKANANAADLYSGLMTITNVSGNTWVAHGGFGNSATSTGFFSAGGVTLSGALDRVRISTTGADTFDAGSVSVMYE